MSPAAVLSVFGIFVVLSGARAAQTDFNADTRAATVALQRYYNAQGLWDTVGWWNAANCIDALENDIVVNHDTNYLATLQKTFALNCRSNFLTGAYDDEGWWAEAWIRAYDLTGNRKYLAAAKAVFADLTTAWDEHCGGGIWWNSARTYKNAIPNELFLLLAAQLHERTPGDAGPGSYLAWATNEWTWFRQSGMINQRHLINDGLTGDCRNNHQTTWTYNQGVVIGGLTELYKITGDRPYLAAAETIADATLHRLTSADGVLEEPGGGDGPDAPEFKGIFARNLACLYDEDHRPAYYNFLVTNALSIWFNDRNRADQLGLHWEGPVDATDAARQTSALMPLAALAEPVTPSLPFARGSGDPAFDHSVGTSAGTLAWTCGPAQPAGWMQDGPYLASLPTGRHVVHLRLATDAVSTSTANLASLSVTENAVSIADATVPWNSFRRRNEARDFSLAFTNIDGGVLAFRVYWNGVSNAPNLTLSDVTVDGAHNWVAANAEHQVGRLDGFNNCEADPVRDTASGCLVETSATDELGAGKYTATFELAVDNFNWDRAKVATLAVVESGSGKIVASRVLRRNQFPNTLYQAISLDFKAKAGKSYQFRTWWHYSPHAPRLTQRSVVVTGR